MYSVLNLITCKLHIHKDDLIGSKQIRLVDGKYTGMNTAIYSPTGASAGIGFAIPVDTIKVCMHACVCVCVYIYTCMCVAMDRSPPALYSLFL